MPNPEPELDTLHLITSTYRPPQAIVALARKEFDKPQEILSFEEQEAPRYKLILALG